jgi:hypothetical protein
VGCQQSVLSAPAGLKIVGACPEDLLADIAGRGSALLLGIKLGEL